MVKVVLSVSLRELFELMSVPKSQQKGDGTDAVTLMELLIQKDSEVKSVLQLGQSTAVTMSLTGRMNVARSLTGRI